MAPIYKLKNTALGMSMAEEILEYHPPKNMGFGQVSLPRKPSKAWPILNDFLNKYTMNEGFTDIKLLYNTWGVKIDEVTEAQCFEALNQLFGKSDEKFIHRWVLDKTQFEKALQFVFETNSWPKQKRPLVTLQFHCRFQWKDINTGELLAGQGEGHNTRDGSLNSYCDFYIDSRIFIQPSLSFPYAYGTSEGMKHLKLIEDNIPLKFSEKHLRRLLPTKTGRYRYLKLEKYQ